jgi:molecular chaperone HscA
MALLQITEPEQDSGQNNTKRNPAETIIGIDLGTTNSLAAIVTDKKVKFFADANGNEIHPSIVNYDGQGNVAGVATKSVVAQELNDEICDKNSSYHDLTKVLKTKNLTPIFSIKRLMGKSFSDVKNQKFTFKIDESGAKEGILQIIIGDKKITPAEVSAIILKYLKDLAEKNLQTVIKKAVITVPAYFDEAAKNATKLAANLAGLEVLRLVNEPTAAALSYGLDNSSEGIYCVYDLGGGTFDISVLKMQKGVFKVLGVAGDNCLGGDDFDDLIMEKFPEITRILAKKIKEELSEKDSVKFENFLIRRSEFEDLIAKKIAKTFTLTRNLISDLELENDEIKGVILVGGSTRIPLVKKKLGEIFGSKKILDQLDPDRIVAAGAAWQAHNLSGQSDNLLLDVVPLSLGIEMMGGIVDKIIYRNTTIPASVTREFTTYADNQSGMKLHVVQGERELAKDCRSLARFEIENIPAMKAGLARIAITFKIDADGLLTVKAEEQITQTNQEIEVRPSYSLKQDEIKKMLLDSLVNSKADIENRLLIEALNKAAQDIRILKKDLKIFPDLITKNESKLITKKLKDLKKIIAKKTSSRKQILLASQSLEKAAENFLLKKISMILNKKISGKKID